ncbi:pyridine nucleotide-disulfide oxidoreductase [Grosmannia clavigera kw1407]|uniref:Pyridine nucleotide-disulfide oxidoreductase n=1 Tax=Grosmannia clavigera (strain kw1407 / UAMH 11150) TaxID=655863 RepID=F0XQQ4_GROCL|nr:pyridine nucleotide-disulfide oxidoreductase [Grosmannia clavigera kw1407]EFW99841.1 pyridine nucleotide-disulfide oxidoreductase [Grosmannia clavigera kw1407]
MAKKTVCIVGAGPSGLVAAKTLLHDPRARGRFRVTVFEPQQRVGGLWPSSTADAGGLVHPQMLANQSRSTVQFSDLAWEDEAAEFPRAWQVGQYLQRYHDRYLGSREDADVRLGWRVVRTERTAGRWQVWTREEDGGDGSDAERSSTFDYLIVASGFFGAPAMPAGIRAEDATVPVVHSSEYRSLATLFGRDAAVSRASTVSAEPTASPSSPSTILVVGGQFSGVEIAGTIANHLSSAAHSPGPNSLPQAASSYSVQHLIQRPSWIFPLYTSPIPNIVNPPFLPFDLNSYNVRKRPRPLVNTQGHIPVETARMVHRLFQNILGTDQSEYGAAVAMRGDDLLDSPPYLGVSDTYLEHVRAGRISVSRGRLASLDGTTAVISSSEGGAGGQEESQSEEKFPVAVVVLATGFSPATSLSFLPDEVKTALSFDATSSREPVALAFHGCCHPDVAGLAFVGFYRSPYWGVMEMQARVATALLVSDADADAAATEMPSDGRPWYPDTSTGWPALGEALAADGSIKRTLALRNDARASQFPMGDYMYLMGVFGEALGLERQEDEDEDGDVGEDCPVIVTPAHYVVEGDDGSSREAALSRRHTATVVRGGLTQAQFVARAVFRSLLGCWRLERDLVSALPSHPSGRFVGTAEFRLRATTEDGRKRAEGEEQKDEEPSEEMDEYLYVEDGTFTATSGLSFRATRRYVWRYNPATDRLSVWFVRTDDAQRADYLFHELSFGGPTATETEPWRATAGHLCIDDYYDVRYDFAFVAVNLRDWRVRYAVRGPKKDYTIDGTYRR